MRSPSNFLQALTSMSARYQAYSAIPISTEISEHDNMLPRGAEGAMAHYMSVGQSAIDVIARALVAVGRREVQSILDLPCGAGRVTRHLRAFFPEADLYAGDQDQARESFVVERFGAKRAQAPVDFVAAPDRSFDLIFVGSLLTHFDKDLFVQAVSWFTAATAPEGLLVMTTHGRRYDALKRKSNSVEESGKWAAVAADVARCGFGFHAYDKRRTHYGLSWSKPSWLMRLTEDLPALRIVSFQEAAWDDHQDVLVLQKRSIED